MWPSVVHYLIEFAQFNHFTSCCVLVMYSEDSMVHTDPLQTGILEEDEKEDGMSKSSFMQHGKLLLQLKINIYVKVKK
jgi:hypothetical protein